MSIIVVEGVDGSGKTTLIDQLRQASIRHFVTLSRSSPPKTLPEIMDVLSWMERGARMATPLICDRHPLISEPIYGRVLRGYSLLTELFSREPNFGGEHFNTYVERVIYVRPSDEVIERYVGHHPQLKGVIPNLKALLHQYDVMMRTLEQMKVPVIHYDRYLYGPPINELFYGEIR